MLEKVVERFIEGEGEKLAVVSMRAVKAETYLGKACEMIAKRGLVFKIDHLENKIIGNNGNTLHFVTREHKMLGVVHTGVFIDDDLQNAEWPHVLDAKDYAILHHKSSVVDKVGPSLPENLERDMFVRVLRENAEKCYAQIVSRDAERVFDLINEKANLQTYINASVPKDSTSPFYNTQQKLLDSFKGRYDNIDGEIKEVMKRSAEEIVALRKLVNEVANERA